MPHKSQRNLSPSANVVEGIIIVVKIRSAANEYTLFSHLFTRIKCIREMQLWTDDMVLVNVHVLFGTSSVNI